MRGVPDRKWRPGCEDTEPHIHNVMNPQGSQRTSWYPTTEPQPEVCLSPLGTFKALNSVSFLVLMSCSIGESGSSQAGPRREPGLVQTKALRSSIRGTFVEDLRHIQQCWQLFLLLVNL